MAKAETREELWGGETTKAIANFPVSGEPIPLPSRAGSDGSRPQPRS